MLIIVLAPINGTVINDLGMGARNQKENFNTSFTPLSLIVNTQAPSWTKTEHMVAMWGIP